MKDILYDLTELLFKAITDNNKEAIKLCSNYIDKGLYDDELFELLSECISKLTYGENKELYDIVKDIDVGYDTSEAKQYLLKVCKRMEVC